MLLYQREADMAIILAFSTVYDAEEVGCWKCAG